MSDEKMSKKEEEALSVLQQARKEKEELQKLIEENKQYLQRAEELRAEDILSGKAPQPKQEEKKEISPQEYSKLALAGQIPR